MRDGVNAELLAAAKAFVSWADDCWGSWAISETTPETLAQYNAAKEAIARAEAALAAPAPSSSVFGTTAEDRTSMATAARICMTCGLSTDRREWPDYDGPTEVANGDSDQRSTPQPDLPQPAAPAESQAAGEHTEAWESSGMSDEVLLVKFREWMEHARQSHALHVSLPLPAAEQIFSHFEAWEAVKPAATPPRSPAQEGFSGGTPQGGPQHGYPVNKLRAVFRQTLTLEASCTVCEGCLYWLAVAALEAVPALAEGQQSSTRVEKKAPEESGK